MKKAILLLTIFTTAFLNAQTSCWKTITSGANFCVGLKHDGTLWAWGENGRGELGIGSNESKNTPVQIGSDIDWDTISSGYGHTLALKENGTLWAWGSNDYGPVGNGTNDHVLVPEQIETGITYISAAGVHSFAIKSDGTLLAWGRNNFGQLGLGTVNVYVNSPSPVGTDTDWRMISGGNFHTLGLKTDGTLWSWGYNFHGQLGQGDYGFGTERSTPTQITGTDVINDWQLIATGGSHSMALKSDGTLFVWGKNEYGQLGSGDVPNSLPNPLPEPITGNWIFVDGGADHTLATDSQNRLWAWGLNDHGQLGDGTFTNRPSPVAVNSVADWKLSLGGLSSSMCLAENDVFTTGLNDSGQLGVGPVGEQNTLQAVSCLVLGTEEMVNTSFTLYPNPADNLLQVQNSNNLVIDRFTVTDLAGKTVFMKETGDVISINIQALESGVYILQFEADGKCYQKRFIKQ